ncbi:hypothetical protein LT85_3818 [Collimonas arenae]|uniref:Uncharacterized protein n=1 Tax=Collimonas arenae TaxID=279058 RepID=A0A0A1FEN4_9BURK|nr:hypothetical protein LT85_3818 [Collimonas arenae]
MLYYLRPPEFRQHLASICCFKVTIPALAFDTRPPVAARTSVPTAVQVDKIQIVIHPSPDMDENTTPLSLRHKGSVQKCVILRHGNAADFLPNPA